MKDYNISKVIADNEGNKEVVISGQLIVKNAEKIKSELLKIKVNGAKLNCIFKNVDDFDTSMAQLVKAFVKHNEEKGVEVICTYELSADLSVLLKRSGIINANN